MTYPTGQLTPTGRRAYRYRRHKNGTATTAVTNQPRFTAEELAYLDEEVARRGMLRSGLVSLLLELICRDRMIAAILDDGKGHSYALPKDVDRTENRQDDLAAHPGVPRQSKMGQGPGLLDGARR